MNDKDARALFRYGYNVGMSFQIIDDILDFTASTEQLGKPTGSDLMQGNITLPVLCAMKDKMFLEKLHHLFESDKVIDEETIEPILKLLLQSDAIEQTYQLSNLYLKITSSNQ